MSVYRVTFVSHAHADNDLCDRYVAALRARGIDIWYDRNNAQAGHFLDREIEQQLEQRSAFALLMTQQALDSFWVQQELGAYRGLMGRDRSRLLLPVRIGPCNVPPLLNALLWIDALAMPFDQAIDAIATALSNSNAPATQPQPQTQPHSTTPEQETLAELLPQLRADFEKQDWYQVRGKAKLLQELFEDELDQLPTEVFTMQGQARLIEGDYEKAKVSLEVVTRREPLNRRAWQAAAEARVRLGEWKEALKPLDRVVTLSNGDAEKLPALRALADALVTVARSEDSDAAHYWWRLERIIPEGLRMSGEQDADWQAIRLEALSGTGRDSEALEVARQLTTLPNASTAQWLLRARLAWKLAGETPTDEVRESLDAASRLAPNDQAIATAHQELLAILMPDRLPPRMAELGFTAQKRSGVAFIVPSVCAVPAGEFLMGSDPRRAWETQSNEQPQHRVNLGAYAIARFPVTVAEYACFVEAAKHRQPNDWANQMQKLDHPVTYVSWDDAVAYAAWLAQTTGQPWRLPIEAEWEKAARWDQRTGVARLYPWGDSFAPSRANTSESGKRTTTAVGSYPNGASPYGAEEMAGNVWEWVHSLYKPYPYTTSDGREIKESTKNRVLRGGSWGSNWRFARAACRNYYRPVLFYGVLGFRLVVAGAGSA